MLLGRQFKDNMCDVDEAYKYMRFARFLYVASVAAMETALVSEEKCIQKKVI